MLKSRLIIAPGSLIIGEQGVSLRVQAEYGVRSGVLAGRNGHKQNPGN
jgi:hypothetical protein